MPARSLLALALLCLAPGSALAAVGQVQPLSVRGDDECVRATGLPGELTLPATDGVRFVEATRAGLERGPVITLGRGFECGSIVSRSNGAGVIAGSLRNEEALVVRVREPGAAAWGDAMTLAQDPNWRVEVVRAAVSDRGDVIVAWREQQSGGPAGSTRRVWVARRAAGGTFGAAEQIGGVASRHELVLPAIAATGEAFVLTTTTADETGSPAQVPLTLWTAGSGTPFGAPSTLGVMGRQAGPALAVAADGRALVAFSDGASILLSEREPGGTFSPAARLGAAGGRNVAVDVTLGAAGEAAVGWLRYARGDAQLASRRGPGPFSPPARVHANGLRPSAGDPFYETQAFEALYFSGGTRSYGERFPNVVLTGDGRAAFAWRSSGRTTPTLISAPLGGGAGSSVPAGRALDTVYTMRALTLADGTAAIAWTEEESRRRFRLHLAASGVREQRQPVVPRVTFGAPRSRTLDDEEPLRLPVSCDRPCLVFAGIGADATNSTILRLPRGGRGLLELEAAAFFAPRPAGPLALSVSFRAPNALRARARTVRVRVARGADVPHPRVTDLRAVRRGESIRVSWRVAGPIAEEDWPYYVTADRTRAARGEPLAARLVQDDGRRFTLTLRAGPEARFVTVRTALEGRAVVRIR